MSTTAAAERHAPIDPGTAPARLVVTWQHPDTRLIEPVGLLSCTEDGFTFRYLARTLSLAGFRPFLGFEDLRTAYAAPRLFPLFAQRVMADTRPDYEGYLQALGLSAPAGAWQVLSRSQGRRLGDQIRVFAEPAVASDGSTDVAFFVSGVRHRRIEDAAAVDAALARLRPGSELAVRSQPDNPQNPLALLLVEEQDVAVGWVPNPLVPHANTISDPVATVVHVGEVDVAPAYRLLVRLTGQAAPGYVPFSGPGWETAA